ncbi:LysR family transcriptional regulator [Rhodophyticola sp.]|uniref:LysR family transcriptional regulator n=1 Tax=Rhodophyticola sp. TaxID=2680032 RepID=UPI003D26DD5A
MPVAPISLNKLLMLDEILACGSISVAASRLNRTQPSVSKALGDLRAFYGDPLLVREGGGLVPTPFAKGLMEALASWRRKGDGLLSMRNEFVPGTSRRHFVIRASDYHLSAFGPTLHEAALSAGASLSFEFISPIGTLQEDFRQMGFDLAFKVNAADTSGFEVRSILSESYVILFDPQHQRRPVDIETFAMADFVLASPAGSGPSAIDRYLRRLGRRRRICFRVPRLSDVAQFVLGSSYLSVVPESTAKCAVSTHALEIAPLFFDVPKVTTSLAWPTSRASDPAVEWLSERLASAVTSRMDSGQSRSQPPVST